MSGGLRRALSPAERRLWAEVARHVAPLPGRARPETPPDPAPASDPPPPPRPVATVRSPSPRPVAAALAPFDRQTARALSRGRRVVDGSIDLHGLDQRAAHAALLGFLRASQDRGHTLVRVVTGKGRPDDAPASGGERGVLRRLTPHWLAAPELRHVVLGLDEAAPRQGGAGALYVRLRRLR